MGYNILTKMFYNLFLILYMTRIKPIKRYNHNYNN